MTDRWERRDIDINIDEVPDETREYFKKRGPDGMTVKPPTTLRDELDPGSDIEMQRELCQLIDEILDDTPSYKQSKAVEHAQKEFTREYALAVPTDEALSYLTEYSPLVELFSGTGYWAYELERRGCDITAFDADPPQNTWTTVKKGTQDALLRYAENTDPVNLLLCWPPVGRAAYEALLVARPDNVFFIGEQPDEGLKMMADDRFFETLDGRYRLVETVELPNLVGLKDHLYHYRPDA